ncbi:hypothetical protein ACWEQV_18350 [Rhodococcus aetherivorans]|nr:hypothetical protein [Rhodococcus aetherivorans]
MGQLEEHRVRHVYRVSATAPVLDSIEQLAAPRRGDVSPVR